MTYAPLLITLEDIKPYLGITTLTTEQEATLLVQIEQAEAIVDELLGGIFIGDRDFYVDDWEEYRYGNNLKIDSPYIGVQSIEKINKNIYTGALEKDYTIRGSLKRELFIANTKGVENNPNYNFYGLEIVVKNGYTPITCPGGIKQLVYLLVEGLRFASDGKEVKSIKVGPKSLSFSSTSQANMFDNLLPMFIPITL